MASAVAGIWNQPSTMHSAATTKTAETASGSDSASISANDFLTLLVTEMQNQDPTADTDPNEYINQLVQVNSLEQLISINQTLTTDSAASVGSNPVQSSASVDPGVSKSTLPAANAQGSEPDLRPDLAGAGEAFGNLSSPAINRAAIKVAQSLGNY